MMRVYRSRNNRTFAPMLSRDRPKRAGERSGNSQDALRIPFSYRKTFRADDSGEEKIRHITEPSNATYTTLTITYTELPALARAHPPTIT
jgi:hypothetical protein